MTQSPRRVFGAVDCGTNSTRVLIADEDGNQLVRELRITRLGQGVDATRTLAEEAIRRCLDALSHYHVLMEAHGVVAARAIATSAVRDAENGADFLEAASAAVGVPVELLPGDEEGRLSFSGAVADLDRARERYVVFDVGGGSTELSGLVEGTPRAVSLDLGCVRVTERFLHHDPPLAAELDDATDFVRAELTRAADVLPVLVETPQSATLVGLAGTVTTLSLLAQGIPEYDRAQVHHSVLPRTAVEEWCARLAAEPTSERARRRAIVHGREDVIVGGALVVREVMRQFGFPELIVSESDILDGMISGIATSRAAG